MTNTPEKLAMLRAGTKKRLHVDRKVMALNAKHNRTDPPITIQTSKGALKVSHAQINGPSALIYSPDKPLSCGAKLWVETDAEVEVWLETDAEVEVS